MAIRNASLLNQVGLGLDPFQRTGWRFLTAVAVVVHFEPAVGEQLQAVAPTWRGAICGARALRSLRPDAPSCGMTQRAGTRARLSSRLQVTRVCYRAPSRVARAKVGVAGRFNCNPRPHRATRATRSSSCWARD